MGRTLHEFPAELEYLEWWISRKSEEMQMTRTMTNGIVNEASSHSVDETVERLKAILQASGAVLFGLVDHSGEAEKVGLKFNRGVKNG